MAVAVAGLVDPVAKRARVLLVDDDVRATRMLARMLREDGFDIEVALDGASAIARIARDSADILVVDFQLPHADGLVIAQYARSRRPDLPVLFVTGYPELVERKKPLLVPHPIVLAKPVAYEALSSALRNAEAALASRRSIPPEPA
jgi:two-component system response regulator MprA